AHRDRPHRVDADHVLRDGGRADASLLGAGGADAAHLSAAASESAVAAAGDRAAAVCGGGAVRGAGGSDGGGGGEVPCAWAGAADAVPGADRDEPVLFDRGDRHVDVGAAGDGGAGGAGGS